MDFALTPEQQKLVERVDWLVKEKIMPRAGQYDRDMHVPVEDIRDLHREGLLLSNLDRKYGGLGFGVDGDDPLSFFLLVEHLAYGNPSTAHCFQVHAHLVQQVSVLADEEQMERWLGPTKERGTLLVSAGSEPRGSIATMARPVEGGYVLNGVKHFATNTPLAEWLSVNSLLEQDGKQSRVRLVVRQDSPGVRIDTSVWLPMGMRACVSPTIHFEDCFVSEIDVLRRPPMPGDDFHTSRWLEKFHLGFAANYLGSSQRMVDWIVAYVKERGDSKDPYRQLRIGELKAQIDSARLLIYQAAVIFLTDPYKAMVMANGAKWFVMEVTHHIMSLGGELAGTTALFQKHPLEQFYRDMLIHLTHGRKDIAAQIVGAAELGEKYDLARTR